ncbi:hypothetical protein ACHAP8_009975 [Fusarium lateritium]
MDHIQYLMTMLERTIAQRPLVIATTSSAAVLVAFAAWCIQDYCDYPALGPGGPPHNVRGWAWITFGIRPFALNPSGTTYVADYPTSGSHPEIQDISHRKGDRSLLGGIETSANRSFEETCEVFEKFSDEQSDKKLEATDVECVEHQKGEKN